MFSCARIDLLDKASISLLADWSGRGSEVPIPSDYWVEIGGEVLHFQEDNNILPGLLPGTYTLLAYNQVPFISITEGIAYLEASGGQYPVELGWLFSAHTEIQYRNNEVSKETIAMQQQVGELNLILKPTGGSTSRIAKIEAKLTGLASGWDLKENKPVGPSYEKPLIFVAQTDGTWKASARTLGFTVNQQTLEGTVQFTDGSPVTLELQTDLSVAIKEFNTKKQRPLFLEAEVETATETDFSVEVKDWIPVDHTGTAQ